MKNLIVLLSGLFLMTLWSCSSDSEVLNNDARLDAEEVERVTNDQQLSELMAGLTKPEKEIVAERKAEVVKVMMEELEGKSPQSDMRDDVKDLLTFAMNYVIEFTDPCPSADLGRFREFSSNQYFYPTFDHNCAEPNDYVEAVTAVLYEVIIQQVVFGDCDYNPKFTINVVKDGDCYWTRLVWRGWYPLA